MKTSSNGNIFSHYWPFVRGIHRSLVISPQKGQWRRALMFSLICTWINRWVNNRGAGDLRRNHAHHDVTVMNYSWVQITAWRLPYRIKPFAFCRPCFPETGLTWPMDQGSTRKALLSKFGHRRSKTVDRGVIFSLSLIHGSSWLLLIKTGPASYFVMICDRDKRKWV